MKQFLALKASAGSGKTFALTVRYISLLLLDVNPTTILTLTFTNKAALEMSQRIYNTLLSLGDDLVILEAISIQTNICIEDIVLKKQTIIDRFISSELSIYTLDKFINKILREFSGYIDINDDFNIDTDDEDLMLYNFLISLDSKQFNLLINFSYKHDKKLNSIIQLFKVLDEKNEILNIKEFDLSLQNKIEYEILNSGQNIKLFILNNNLSNSAKKAVDFNTIDELLDKGKTWLTKDSLSEFSFFKKVAIPPSLDDDLDNIKHNLSLYYKYKQINILNHLFSIFNNFKEFRLKYKKNKNSFEFIDITNLVFILLSKVIEKDFLYFRLDIKYNHMLIDEFQDTSVLQYKILEPLIDEILSGYSENFRTFFYVGDIKQSIYRFRGGTKELFDFVINKYSNVLELESLDVNYRSSINVVGFVNKIFNSLNNYEYDIQNVNSSEVGYIEITNLDLEKDDPFENIKDKLRELFKKGLNPNNIAILTYTNNDVLELYKYLKVSFPELKILTELTSKLINQINIKASINLIKYIYFNEIIYKSNFNSLMGFDIDKTIEFKLNLQTNNLVDIVHMIALKYNLIDDNMVKFIDIVSSYSDIVDFIYEIDNNDATMINKEKNGLQILTVFKSKGLEFDTVLVLDRVKRKNIDRSTILFEYENIKLKDIYYKMKFRENFDKEYEIVINNEKDLNRGDELNILYVALTRAKNNLIILKKEKQSVFDVLEYDFNYCSFGSLTINNIDNNVYQSDLEIKYNPLSLGVQDIQKQENIETVENIKARYFGIATHYCLEMMSKFNIKSLKLAIDLVRVKYSNILDDNSIDEIEHRINLLINNNDFNELIINALYTKEQELTFNNEIRIIDLLIEKEDKYIIIDYKTTKNKEESHKKQILNYKNAIKNITNGKKIEGYIVYLYSDRSEIVLV